MNKISMFFLLIILLTPGIIIPGVMAGEVVYGYIHINIVNKPPELQNIKVQDIKVQDSLKQQDSFKQIDCIADIVDENPSKVKIIKKWYANNNPVEKSRIKYGDIVRCELLPIDELGQEGATYSIQFKMPEPKLEIIQLVTANF